MKHNLQITQEQIEKLKNAYILYGFCYGDHKSEWDIDRLNDIIDNARTFISVIMPVLAKSGIDVKAWRKQIRDDIRKERKGGYNW